METHPIIVFSTKYQLNLVAAVLVVTIVGGFVWWKNFSPQSTPPPLTTTANDTLTPHWAHQAKPFSLQLKNSASAGWSRHLNEQIENWNQARAASVIAVPGDENDCSLVKDVISLCSFEYSNSSTLAFTQSIYNENTLHYESAYIGLNDALLAKGTVANSPEWRSSVLCRHLGIALGAPLRFDEPSKVSSCMSATVQSESFDLTQSPDQIDINSLTRLYHQNDPAEFVPMRYSLPASVGISDITQWGRLIESDPDGNIDIYELYLGEGFKMVTVVEKL